VQPSSNSAMKTLSRLFGPVFAVLALVGFIALGPGQLLAADETNTAKTSTEAAHPAGSAVGGHAHSHDGHAEAHGEGKSLLREIGLRYLTAYMFCLSICVGALFLILIHHLFDASWSVPIRRVNEQLASLLFPWMLILLAPILALQQFIYPWLTIDPATDHSLAVKRALFNTGSFNVLLPVLVASWGWIAHTFRKWSIAQDKDGAALWTRKARVLAAGGIFYFSLTLTLVCFYLMKSLQHQFFSTMYGVYYFAGSVWTTLITVWVLVLWLRATGPLRNVIHKRQIQDVGVWFFAFTVFYAYIHFSQYFLIWNAAIPEETFWYVNREAGGWKWVGFTILFGHFVVPFLVLLNQDVKLNPAIMFPMCGWAWLMHFVDMTFNIMPTYGPLKDGPQVSFWDPLFWFGMAGFLGFMFLRNFRSSAPYPLRDPRLKEAVTHHEVPAPGAPAHH
jgi:hypothetical protein